MANFNYFNLSFLLGGITCYVTGIWVYIRNRHSPVNKSWLALSLNAGTWSISHFLMSITESYQLAWVFCYILYGAAILIPSFYMYFIFSLLDESKKRRKEIFSSFLISFAFLILMPTKLFIKDVTPKLIFNYYDELGPLSILFILFFITIPAYSLYRLFLASSNESRIKALQLKYVALASIFGFLGGGSTFLLALNIPFPPYLLILFVFYPLIITYAILKYRLMDIRVAVTRTGIFLAVYTFVLGGPLFLAMWGRWFLVRFLGENWWVVPLLLVTALAAIGPYVYIYFQRRAEKIILKEQFAYRRTLKQAAKELASIHNLNKLLNLIVHIVTRTVRVSHASIYLYDNVSKSYVLKASRNFKKDTRLIGENEEIIKWLKEHREPLVYDDVAGKAQVSDEGSIKDIKTAMQELGAKVVVPAFLRENLLGFLVLGEKRGGKFYSLADLNTFAVLANEAGLAVENAKLYESMEERIRQRTEELMETQKQLIQAEKMATVGTLAGGVAHQINNPLTAILTNVQMLMRDSRMFDAEVKESLEMIEEATKNCRYIIQKLMTYSKKPTDMEKSSPVNISDVLKDVLSLLRYQLEQENVSIVADIADGDYYVMGDHNELEQVIVNLILNAKDAIREIKKSGTVRISFLKESGWVKIMVEDKGKGIPPDILPKIFEPFFTTKDVGKGTGLGLSVCQAIVEKYGGTITVVSQAGKGSVFTVKLPAMQ